MVKMNNLVGDNDPFGDNDDIHDGENDDLVKSFEFSGTTVPRNALCWLQGRGKGNNYLSFL